jgi:hypothetical protein
VGALHFGGKCSPCSVQGCLVHTVTTFLLEVINCPLMEGNRPRRFLSPAVGRPTFSNYNQFSITSPSSSNQVACKFLKSPKVKSDGSGRLSSQAVGKKCMLRFPLMS